MPSLCRFCCYIGKKTFKYLARISQRVRVDPRPRRVERERQLELDMRAAN